MPTNFLVIGDPHIQVKNFHIIEALISRVELIITKLKPDAVVILGDTLHNHEKVDSRCLNLAIKLVDTIRKKKPCFLLVGNHDYIHNKVYLSEQHPFNALKEWPNVHVIDKPRSFTIDGNRFVFCPYVEEGRLQEALGTLEVSLETIKPKAIFCHATFKGAIMDNGLPSPSGEETKEHFYISGHIHKSGWVGKNVFYPGTPYQTTFGEDDKKGICCVTFNQNPLPDIKFIDILLPKKIVIKTDVKDLDKIQLPQAKNIDVKVIITGDLAEIKEKKKEIEDRFKDHHIQMKPDNVVSEGKYRGKHFKEVLFDLIAGHNLALQIYNECYK